MIGISHAEHWNTTPVIYQKQVKAHFEKLKIWDRMNHLLGNYIMIAFNSPKSYPKEATLSKEKKQKFMSDTEMERMMRINNARMGGTVNK